MQPSEEDKNINDFLCNIEAYGYKLICGKYNEDKSKMQMTSDFCIWYELPLDYKNHIPKLPNVNFTVLNVDGKQTINNKEVPPLIISCDGLTYNSINNQAIKLDNVGEIYKYIEQVVNVHIKLGMSPRISHLYPKYNLLEQFEYDGKSINYLGSNCVM